MKEKTVIKSCQNGDKCAFDELVRFFYPYVSKYSLKLTNNPNITEDLTQETFVKIIRTIDTYNINGKATFSTYIITVAKNCYIDYYRKNKEIFTDITEFEHGKELHIFPNEIGKGDLMELHSGSIVCCDCIIQSGSAEINESILTGESEPVAKLEGDTLLSGSTVISGKCVAETVCENEDSFTSKITDEVKKTKQGGSELLISMKKVTKFTSFLIISLGILLFIQGYFLEVCPLKVQSCPHLQEL